MPIKSIIRALGLVLVSAAPGVQGEAGPATHCFIGCPSEGREFRDALLAAIDQADQIVVTEHSSPWDAFDAELNRSLIEQEFEYARVSLSSEQETRFRDIVAQVDPATQNWASACIPAFHHTVRFYQAGILKSTLQICFECSQVRWDGIKGVTPPGAIYQSLEQAITSVGLNPKRKWSALARQRLAAN